MASTLEVARRALAPSFLPVRLRPATVLAACLRPVTRRGRSLRKHLATDAVVRFDALLPDVIDVAMKRLGPTELVRRYVDLDALVAGVDLDAVVAGVDLDAVVAGVDLDAVAARLDVDAVVARVDLDEVASRIDIEAVLDRVD